MKIKELSSYQRKAERTKDYLQNYFCKVCNSKNFIICRSKNSKNKYQYKAVCKDCGFIGNKVQKEASLNYCYSFTDVFPEEKYKNLNSIWDNNTIGKYFTGKYQKSGYKTFRRKCVHREVYIKNYGKIEKGWQIHHINMIKHDNRPDNLIALPKQIHNLIHSIIKIRNETLNRLEINKILRDNISIIPNIL